MAEQDQEKSIEKYSAEIIEKFSRKGWALYFRGLAGEEIPMKESHKRGPVSSLKKGIFYALRPKVSNPTDEDSIIAFSKKHRITMHSAQIKIPADCGNNVIEVFETMEKRFGAEIAGTRKEDYRAPVKPGSRRPFIGIKLLGDDSMFVFSEHRIEMPCSIFLKSIENLIDLTEMKE
ncbi:hypothetical protein KKB43_05700 [Patescibacteria group bacterium]|nr:hypothetical protein [Patescibacteria group bacterium]MBU4580477.1 hypothetical protein [Patescibacteria group bacterium]